LFTQSADVFISALTAPRQVRIPTSLFEKSQQSWLDLRCWSAGK